MIKSFKNKAAEEIFLCEYSRKVPEQILRNALRKLWWINAANTIWQLRSPPSNHLERLKGDREGQYSIRINKQWRICFYWVEGDAYELEITDYH
ncbi:MAG: type II toxin-antitoxin system RelE/ParE family toxin [Candidatus Gracilibacteria bacterium]